MKTLELKEKLKSNQKFVINLSFAGFFHFLADFLPVSTLYIYAENLADFFFIVTLYNLCAFALQPFIGLIIDRYEKTEKSFCVVSILLLLFGALITFNFYICAIFLGLGNAIFHVAFAKDVLKKSKSSFPLGVFIAPGVLGLGLGFTFLNDILRVSLIIVGFIAFFSYLRFAFNYHRVESNEKEAIRNYKSFNFSLPLFITFVLFTVLSVFFRGSLGKLTPSLDVVNLFLYVSIIAFVGKFIGGLFPKRICLILSLVLSIVSSIFINNLIGLLIFTFSINILMPLTLDYLRKLFYKYEATSLGLSAFVLLIGTFLFNSVNGEYKEIFFWVFLVLHLAILAFFFCVEFIATRKKSWDLKSFL